MIIENKKTFNNRFNSSISVDLEDAINIGMKKYFGKTVRPTKKVVENTLRLLDFFSEMEVKATFFILGEVAQEFPLLIKKISSLHHEIAIHGLNHSSLKEATPKTFYKDIDFTKKLIEDLSGTQVYGFRAPFLSISYRNIWVLDVLKKLEFKYDSSIINKKVLTNISISNQNGVYKIVLKDGSYFLEIPPSTFDFFNYSIPVCSGGYLRFMPFWITRLLLLRIKTNSPVFYIHPYEIDDTPLPLIFKQHMAKVSFLTRIMIKKSCFNRKLVLPRLEKILKENNFTTIQERMNIINRELIKV